MPAPFKLTEALLQNAGGNRRGPRVPSTSAGTLPGMMNGGMMGAGMMNRDQMRQMIGAGADFDRMFRQMMIPHHQGAISMAQQALAQAEHPEIKTLAQGIVTTQQTEITEMQGYLRDLYREGQ